MKKFFLICAVVVVLSSCGSPSPDSGYVIERRFTPAHWQGGWDTRTTMKYVCGNKSEYDYVTGDYESRYTCDYEPDSYMVWEERHTYVDDSWQLKLEDCDEPEGDKEPKCNTGWLTVPESEYDDFPVGVHYPTHIKENSGRP